MGIHAANDAVKSGKGKVTSGLKPSPIDQNYSYLNANMSSIQAGSEEYKMIEKYIKNGSGG